MTELPALDVWDTDVTMQLIRMIFPVLSYAFRSI